MPKVPIESLAAGFRSSNRLNANFETIQDAFDNTLSRNGSGPNHMEAELDMNSNRLINLPTPTTPTEPLRLGDIGNITLPDILLYKPDIDGTGYRTVSSMFDETLSAVSFIGVDPTGVSDSWEGLQNFFTAAAGRKAVIPPGKYLCSQPIVLVVGKPYDVEGCSPNVYGNLVSGGTIIVNTNTSGQPLFIYDNSSLAITEEFHSRFSNMGWFGNQNSGDGFYASGLHFCTFDHLWISSHGGSGINLVQDCWSNTISDCSVVQNGACGLSVGRRTNALYINGGKYIANARRSHGGDTFGNIRIIGTGSSGAGFESRGIVFNGPIDVSYAGQNPYAGATVTRAWNFYAENCIGLTIGGLYSEDGIGDASDNTIKCSGIYTLSWSGGYVQNGNVSITCSGGDINFAAAPTTMNMNIDASGSSGEGLLVVSKDPGAAFTVTTSAPYGWVPEQSWQTYTPTVVSTTGTITSSIATVRYSKKGKTILFNAFVQVTNNGTGSGTLFITLPVNVRAGGVYFARGQNQNTATMFDATVNASGITTIGYPIATGQSILLSGFYESV